jgi:prepilin-type N-terminal cleavage/methylation domain-containing protein
MIDEAIKRRGRNVMSTAIPPWRSGARQGPRLRAALSLIELLIVVSLLGILAAAVLPLINPGIASQLQTTAQIVAADLAYARNLAVTNASTYRLTFDIPENRYVLRHSGANTLLHALPPSPLRKPSDPPDRQTTDLDELPRSGPRTLIAAAQLAPSRQSVRDVEFGALGQLTSGQPTIVYLAAGSGTSRRYLPIHVEAITGMASIGDIQSAAPPDSSGVTNGMTPPSP